MKNKPPTPHTLSEILLVQQTSKIPIWGPITRKSITLLYGSTGVGKSFFVWGLLYTMASGLKFCGHIPTGRHTSIVLDGEMDVEDAAHRLRMIMPENDMDVGCDSINILTREDFGTGLVPNISIPSSQEMYSGILIPFDVIVIDNLNTTSYPKNDRDGEISQFLRVLPWLLKLRDSGKAVILVHHTNKQGQQMGSILKEQIATNVLELEKVSGESTGLKFKMVWHKHRHVARENAKPMIVEAIPSPSGMSWIVEDPSDGIVDRVIQMAKDGMKQREIAEQVDLDLYEVSKIIKRGNKAKGLFNGMEGNCNDEF